MARKFATASHVIQAVGVSDLAAYTQAGVAVATPKFPFEIIFSPDSALTAAYTDDFQAGFLTQLPLLASGTTLY